MSLLVLTGTDGYSGLIASRRWDNDERVLDAYNALTTPLPVIEDGDVELYCEQNLTELHRRQNVEGPRTVSSCSSCAPKWKPSSTTARGQTRTTSPSPKPTIRRSKTSDTPSRTRKTKHSKANICPKTMKRSEP